MRREPRPMTESRKGAGGSDGYARDEHNRGRGVTIDRRLRSGEAPNGALLAIWLSISTCIVFAAFALPVPGAGGGGLGPILLSCVALGAVMLGLARTAWRLLGREACVATCLLLPLNPLVLAAFLPHADPALGWQMAASALAVWSLSARRAEAGASLAGGAMGAGCALGSALWPVAAAVGTLLFTRWLRDHRASGEFSGYLKGFAVVALPFALAQEALATGPACAASILAPTAAVTLLLLGAVGLKRIPRLAPAMLTGGMFVIGAAAMGVAAALRLACGAAPFAPFAAAAPISEAGVLMLALLPVLLGLGASLYLWRSNGDWLRRWWRDYAWILGAAGMGGIVVPGLPAVAACLAAMPLGWLAAQLLFGHRRGGGRKWWPASLAAILAAAGTVSTIAHAVPEQRAQGLALAYADSLLR